MGLAGVRQRRARLPHGSALLRLSAGGPQLHLQRRLVLLVLPHLRLGVGRRVGRVGEGGASDELQPCSCTRMRASRLLRVRFSNATSPRTPPTSSCRSRCCAAASAAPASALAVRCASSSSCRAKLSCVGGSREAGQVGKGPGIGAWASQRSGNAVLGFCVAAKTPAPAARAQETAQGHSQRTARISAASSRAAATSARSRSATAAP